MDIDAALVNINIAVDGALLLCRKVGMVATCEAVVGRDAPLSTPQIRLHYNLFPWTLALTYL